MSQKSSRICNWTRTTPAVKWNRRQCTFSLGLKRGKLYGCLLQCRNRKWCSTLFRGRQGRISQQKILKTELQAALYAVRLSQINIERHDITVAKDYHRTHSFTVLPRVHSAHKMQQMLVVNRIGERLDCSNINEWRHAKGTENPRDTGTHGMTVFSWLSVNSWLRARFGQMQDMWPEHIKLGEETDV